MSMENSQIPLGDAAKLIGKTAKTLRKMVEDGQIKAQTTPSGQLRFSREDLTPFNQGLSSVKSELSQKYVRPKRLISPSYREKQDKGDLMQSYIRDVSQCLGFCKGFQGDTSGALALLIDLMALHADEEGGVPCEPKSYICGMIGIGERKWTQTIEKTLVKAGRIKQITRKGIKVWVFPDDQMRGPKALFKPIGVQTWVAPSKQEDVQFRDMHLQQWPDAQSQSDPVPKPIKPTPPPAIEEIAPPSMPMPAVIEDTTPIPDVPSHSAYEVLKQAGVDVEGHERGELFWYRSEHAEVLNRWLETVPVNEIVVRIDKARIAGNLPKSPNGLLAYENIVLGG
jgi:hypothetical protein